MSRKFKGDDHPASAGKDTAVAAPERFIDPGDQSAHGSSEKPGSALAENRVRYAAALPILHVCRDHNAIEALLPVVEVRLV